MERLIKLLRTRGILSGVEIRKELGISQPVMSRLVRRAGPRVCRFGRSVATRYALSREIAGLGRETPIFRVDENGHPSCHAVLHFLSGDRYWLQRESGDVQPYVGLPPFVDDMRPQGYIGRGFSAQFPELSLPSRLNDWSDDHQLIALARRGEDCIGNLIIGEESINRFLAEPLRSFTRSDYPDLAAGMLLGQPGSSAGGEHPKFAVYSEGHHHLVKFAMGDGAAADRWRDLLVCEHLALEVLRNTGIPTPRSEWFDFNGSRYLEMERYDRVGKKGRRGVISLFAINSHHLDPAFDHWSGASRRILKEPSLKMDVEHAERMVWLDTFGDLIGNTDRHFGNFSFFAEEARELSLTPTPVYDMLPMVFAPTDANVVDRPFTPSPPNALNMHLWRDVASHALNYWSRICEETELSMEFRMLTEKCRVTVAKLIEAHGAINQ